MQYKSGRTIVCQEENISFPIINEIQYNTPIMSNAVVNINPANIHQFHPSHLHGLLSIFMRHISEAHQQNVMHRALEILPFKNSVLL